MKSKDSAQEKSKCTEQGSDDECLSAECRMMVVREKRAND